MYVQSFIIETGSDIKEGLKSDQVEENKKRYGQNVIPKKELKTFFQFFT